MNYTGVSLIVFTICCTLFGIMGIPTFFTNSFSNCLNDAIFPTPWDGACELGSACITAKMILAITTIISLLIGIFVFVSLVCKCFSFCNRLLLISALSTLIGVNYFSGIVFIIQGNQIRECEKNTQIYFYMQTIIFSLFFTIICIFYTCCSVLNSTPKAERLPFAVSYS